MNTDYEQSYGIVKTQVQFTYVLGVTLIVINVLMIFVKWLRTPTFAILDLPDVLVRLYRLLKKQGIMYVSFKLGDGERQKDGRYFNDMREEVLCRLLCGAGFTVKETYITQDVRENRSDEAWVNVIAEKMLEGALSFISA